MSDATSPPEGAKSCADGADEPQATELDNFSTSPGTEQQLTRAAVTGAAWISVERVATNLVSLAAFIVLGHELTPSSFGVVAAASTVILLLRLVVDGGFSRALVQRQVLTADLIDTAFWTAMAIGCLLTVMTIVGAPLVAAIFHEPQLTAVTRALSPVFVLAALDNTQSALVDRRMEFKVQAIRRFVATTIAAAVAVLLAVTGAGVWALVAQTLSLEIILVILLWSLTHWHPRWRFSRQHFVDLVGWGGNALGIRGLTYIYGNADNFLIGWRLGPSPLGIYVIAYRVFDVVNEVMSLTIEQVSLPLFSRYQSDNTGLRRVFNQTTSLGALVGWPVYALLALTASQSVPLVFGHQWQPSARVMEALALAGLVQVSWSCLRVVMMATGRVRNELKWNAVLAGTAIAAFVATVHFGVAAVALSLGGVGVLLLPWRVRQVTALCGLSRRSFLRSVVGPGMATAVMAAAVVAVKLGCDQAPSLVALAAELVTAAICYPLAVRALAPAAWRTGRLAVNALRR